ncbi:MAG: DNA-3-methyladenine glycosylase [Acidimicrobiaceae bacterium]|nr:DNA-3-methyladenine glycosylase [Acidimicrobiaceae bacterium]
MLLGMLIANGDTGLIITEVEAYGGSDDAASHAYKGVSQRNRSMFGDAGTLYVYLSYGIHRCINIVAGEVGDGQAVLIRSGVVVSRPFAEGRAQGLTGKVVLGPGRVGRALGAELSDDGTDLLSSGEWQILDTKEILNAGSVSVLRSGRIGISKAREVDWRFEINPREFLEGLVDSQELTGFILRSEGFGPPNF